MDSRPNFEVDSSDPALVDCGAAEPDRRVPEPAQPGPESVAILVLHGIGEQRPYETLDSFCRGLLSSLRKRTGGRSWIIQPQLESRQDPTRQQQQWTQASIQLIPDEPVASFSDPEFFSIRKITAYEYYWAPITEGKVSYSESLIFLLQATLKPFQYLSSNINAILNAETAAHARALKKSEIAWVTLREFSRILMLFTPLLLGFLGLLYWLHRISFAGLLAVIRSEPQAIPNQLTSIFLVVILLVLRYLYLYTNGSALIATVRSASNSSPTPARQSRARALSIAGFSVLAILELFSPFWIPYVLKAVAAAGFALAHGAANGLHLAATPAHLHNWSTALASTANNISFANQQGHFWAWFFLYDPALLRFLPLAGWLLLAYFVRWILIHYIGDIAVYANADQRSANFDARAQILEECTDMLSSILKEQRPNVNREPAIDGKIPSSIPKYDRVLLAGHSLGSVIAYDTLNEMLNRVRTSDPADPAQLQVEDLLRLRGMVTFGCPLNKMYYFFREQMSALQTIRKQTIDLLHSFRIWKCLATYPPDQTFSPPEDPIWIGAEDALNLGFRWINAYSLADPVSGRLLFYDLHDAEEENQMSLFYIWFGEAHLAYWTDPKFYDFVESRLL